MKAIVAKRHDLELERWLRRRNAGLIVWRTKDGTIVPIKDMSDEHLDRTIAMIERNLESDAEYWEALSSCSAGDLDRMM